MEKELYIIRLGVIKKLLLDNKQTIKAKHKNIRLNKEIEMAINDITRIYTITKFCTSSSVIFYSEITEEVYTFDVPNIDEEIPFLKRYIVNTDLSKIQIQYRELDIKTGKVNEEYYDSFIYEEGISLVKKQRR